METELCLWYSFVGPVRFQRSTLTATFKTIMFQLFVCGLLANSLANIKEPNLAQAGRNGIR